MDDLDIQIPKNRTGLIVALVLLGGIGVLAVGGYLVWQKRAGGEQASVEVPATAEQWCKLRQDWAAAVKPLAGEIMIKLVQEPDSEAFNKLVAQRNTLCQENASKLQELVQGDPKLWTLVEKVEEALIREGKVRSNVSVEIANLRNKTVATTSEELNKSKEELTAHMAKRIKDGQAEADRDVQAAMDAAKPFSCGVFYRGPMTDKGTSGNPHITWGELELRRTLAIKAFDDALKALEPLEEFTNLVYHDMVSRYRGTLKTCYKKAKSKNPEMSDSMGLRVRLKKDGKVATLGIEWMTNRDEGVLDCLLETATTWQLSRPPDDIEVVTVTMDFTKL